MRGSHVVPTCILKVLHFAFSLIGDSAEMAFRPPETNQYKSWVSSGDPPHHVWFQFEERKTLTKIGFSTRRHIDTAPKKFEVVASVDCNRFMDTAEVLLVVENAGFVEDNQAKSWAIPEAKQAPYLCIGIKVISVNDDNTKGTELRYMIMWEKKS